MHYALLICSLCFICLPNRSSAQVFWSEDFGTGCSQGTLAHLYAGTFGTWVNTNPNPNDALANVWYVSATEQGNGPGVCSSGCGGSNNRTLHIGNVAGSPLLASCPGGDCGALYDFGVSAASVATDRRIQTPVINCTGHFTNTLAFNYMEAGNGTFDNGEVWYFNGSVWALLVDLPKTNCCGSVPCASPLTGLWQAYSIALPASADNNFNVRIAFRWYNDDDGIGTQPSFAIDDITISSVPANTITTGNIFSGSYCACDTVNVPFTSTGTFIGGNTYTAQLSNAVGSFAAPVVIGTLASVANSGTIACTIPCITPAGTQYRIRVISSTPADTGSINTSDITINAPIVTDVTITASPGASICSGANATFTATNTNSVPTPAYQWLLNGVAIGGANASTYSTTTLLNGDVISCELSSSGACVTSSPDTSNLITMTVSGTAITALISIVADQNPICAGTMVNFTATNTNSVPSASFQWQVNGVNVGTGLTFSSNTLANGNTVICILTSTDPCVVGTPANSNTIIMTVSASLVSAVSLVISPNDTICTGDPVSFVATPSNGGLTPTYAWTLNGTPVGTNDTTYSNLGLVDGDIVVCTLTSSLPCVGATSSASYTITVDPGGIASVSIVSTPPDTACPGQNVTFTATPTNGGSTPSYQWFVNGVPVGTDSPSFLISTLNNGDVVACQLTSSSACVTGSPALSPPKTLAITNTLTADVVITGPTDTICEGDPVTIWAAATNGGLTPTYVWQVNGSADGLNQDNFTSSSLHNGDQIVCVLISSDPCAFSGVPVSSGIYTMKTKPCPLPVSKFVTDRNVICQNDCVNFTDVSDNLPIAWHWVFEGANPPESWDQNPTNVCYANPGTYYVELVTTNSRGSHDTIVSGYIIVDDITSINAGEDVEMQVGSTTQLSATGGNNYNWSPAGSLSCADCKDPIASPTVTTTYILSDSLGCPSSDTVVVKVFEEFEIYVPNAFSPNGDGENDVLYVRGNGIVDVYMLIYDRIGEKVFVGGTKEAGWDGSFRGKDVNPGVFSYFVRANMLDGSTITKKGNVTVFR